MKLKFFIFLILLFNICHAQTARSIVEDACIDGAKIFSKIGMTTALELFIVASETNPNSAERSKRLKIHENQRDKVIGELKSINRKGQDDWIKQGIDRDIASLRRKTLDLTIYISMDLAQRNPRWDLERLILEVREKCELTL
jgi:hypothetical protein